MKNQPVKKDFNDIARRSVAPPTALDEELLKSAEKGNAAKVALLIRLGANPFIRSEQPLLLAAQNGHLEVVKLLMAEGSLGLMRFQGPTFAAERNGHTEIARLLKGALNEHRQRGLDHPHP